MKKNFFLCLFSLLSSLAYADSVQTLSTPEGEIKLHLNDSLHRALSSQCFPTQGALPQCDAWQVLQRVHKMPVDRQAKQDPGLRLCKNVTGGTLVIGKDTRGNEQGLCKYRDGSMTTTQSLFYYSNKR